MGTGFGLPGGRRGGSALRECRKKLSRSVIDMFFVVLRSRPTNRAETRPSRIGFVMPCWPCPPELKPPVFGKP